MSTAAQINQPDLMAQTIEARVNKPKASAAKDHVVGETVSGRWS